MNMKRKKTKRIIWVGVVTMMMMKKRMTRVGQEGVKVLVDVVNKMNGFL